MSVRYVFDTDEMRGLADHVRRAGEEVGDASHPLMTAQFHAPQLPPEARGLVEAQCRALWLLVHRAAASLSGSARYLHRTAEAVENADRSSWTASGLRLVKITTTGEAVADELADTITGKPALGDRARRWAGVLGTLTGVTAVGLAVQWSEWRKALRESNVSSHSPAARKFSAALGQRTREGVERNLRRAAGPPPDFKDGKWKQWGRRVAGYLPGPAGDAADLAGYAFASAKLRSDEQQTGISQVATDVRDFVDLVAASNHVAADFFFKSPLTAPAGAINEGIGFGADGVTLGLDTLNEARKALGSVHDDVVDGFTSLTGIG